MNTDASLILDRLAGQPTPPDAAVAARSFSFARFFGALGLVYAATVAGVAIYAVREVFGSAVFDPARLQSGGGIAPALFLGWIALLFALVPAFFGLFTSVVLALPLQVAWNAPGVRARPWAGFAIGAGICGLALLVGAAFPIDPHLLDDLH